MLTAEELRKQLDYDPATGVFTWRVANTSTVQIGEVAGSYEGRGYRRVYIQNREYKAHRLAWLYVHGTWPRAHIDHINGVRDDNRITNLREATYSENSRNRKRRCDTRVAAKGVDLRHGRFRAQIKARGKNIHLGYYDTEEEAHAAYMAAAEKEFGAFARAE